MLYGPDLASRTYCVGKNGSVIKKRAGMMIGTGKRLTYMHTKYMYMYTCCRRNMGYSMEYMCDGTSERKNVHYASNSEGQRTQRFESPTSAQARPRIDVLHCIGCY